MTALIAMPGNEAIADALATHVGLERTRVITRRFPDGETYVRLETPAVASDMIIVCTLDRPDDKFLPLAFLTATAREQGVKRVGLIAPYLAYLRQDRRFQPGEAITSKHFARLLSGTFDWLITIDPHLHRYGSLAEIYRIPTQTLTAAAAVAQWIRGNVAAPLLIGPDGESAQWAQAVARASGAPSIILEKVRHGDRDVEVSVPDVARWRSHTPILVDDIISTAHTMIAIVRHLKRAGLAAPVCIGTHAIFAGDAYDALRAAGAARIVSCNTVVHPSNAIDVSGLIAEAMEQFMTNSPTTAEAKKCSSTF